MVGDADPVLAAKEAFSDHLEDLGIPHTFEVLKDVGHHPRELFAALARSQVYWRFYREQLAP
ncbi:MAG: hypothetical protein AAFU65_15890 [Pseudomonadota bacterium]